MDGVVSVVRTGRNDGRATVVVAVLLALVLGAVAFFVLSQDQASAPGSSADLETAGGAEDDFLSSDCVSCGACVQACPTATLQEKSVIELGTPDRSVVTTCAYCGVGCSFKAELNGDEVVRMTPWKHGKANRGHSCVKGRFAYGYASHSDRILNPMIRDSVDEPWREVSWEEAMEFTSTT